MRYNDGKLDRISSVGEERVERLGHGHPVAGEHQHGDHHRFLQDLCYLIEVIIVKISSYLLHDLVVLVCLCGVLVLVGGVDEDLPLLDDVVGVDLFSLIAVVVLVVVAIAALSADDLGVSQLADLVRSDSDSVDICVFLQGDRSGW